MSTVDYPHITIGPDGVPRVEGTRTKVVQVAIDHVAHGWDANEIHRQYPHLGLSQIHSALAYYFDHKAELDAYIERSERQVETIRQEIDKLKGPCPARQKLRDLGLIP